MTQEFWFSMLSVVAISLASLVGLFAIPMQTLGGRRVFTFLVSFSAGALLGDVFIHLLPELAEEGNFTFQASLTILGTIMAFFVLEKYLHWHHHHGEGKEGEHAAHPYTTNILLGDSVHNFIDGLVIAGAYQLDVRLGLATTLAVVLHEIPQEIGDFGVLIHGGFTKAKALLYNFISALSAILGAVAVFTLGDLSGFLPYLAALGAGSFIYIAVADLIPEIHKEHRQPLSQLFAFALGIGIMFLLLLLE
jgi:zinc and cadmium transporter